MQDTMESPPPPQPKAGLKKRKLKIKCTPTLDWQNDDCVSATMEFDYTANGSEPGMPNSIKKGPGGKVTIDVLKMPFGTAYSNDLEISMKLETNDLKDKDGNKFTGTARWAYADEGPYTYGGQPGDLGYLWFCQANPAQPLGYDKLPPISIPGVSRSRKSDKVIEIEDDRPVGGAEYGFCVGLMVEYDGEKCFIEIDPMVSGKGIGSPPNAAPPKKPPKPSGKPKK